jgi:hypothetical protein
MLGLFCFFFLFRHVWVRFWVIVILLFLFLRDTYSLCSILWLVKVHSLGHSRQNFLIAEFFLRCNARLFNFNLLFLLFSGCCSLAHPAGPFPLSLDHVGVEYLSGKRSRPAGDSIESLPLVWVLLIFFLLLLSPAKATRQWTPEAHLLDIDIEYRASYLNHVSYFGLQLRGSRA